MTAPDLALHILAAGVLFGVITRLAKVPCDHGPLGSRVRWNLWVLGQVLIGVGAIAMLMGHLPLAAGFLLAGIALHYSVRLGRRSGDR